MQRKLIFIVGSSGAGKTTLSEMLAKKYDFALLSEDNFVYIMNPKTMITRRLHGDVRRQGMECLRESLQVYLRAERSVVVEGAFVDGPYYLRDFREMARKYNYAFIPLLLDGDERKRRKRKKRQGYAIPQEVDSRLKCSVEQLGYFKECFVSLVKNLDGANV
ncbi:MAG: ATP-binding protein [Candidatus Saccharibacteria bacterium]|nr:ATP-binding protein [Candidatus Saccharibacteria bacterium]